MTTVAPLYLSNQKLAVVPPKALSHRHLALAGRWLLRVEACCPRVPPTPHSARVDVGRPVL